MISFFRFDEINENDRRFFAFFDIARWNFSKFIIYEWLKTVWICFENNVKNWTNNNSNIIRINHVVKFEIVIVANKIQFIVFVQTQYFIEKFVVIKQFVVIEQFVVIHINMQQNRNEIIKEYYLRTSRFESFFKKNFVEKSQN